MLATNLRAVTGRAYPRVRGSLREKSWIFFEIALPFLSTCAFVLVYRALQAPEAYIGFAVLGGAMTAFWLNVLWAMGAQLYWDRGEGNLEIYFTAPINLMSILVGMAVGGLYMTVTRALVIIVMGSVLFDVQYAIDQWLLLGGRLPPDPGRALRARDAHGQPLPVLGPRGVAPGQPLPGAGLLPRRPLRAGQGAGAPRRARDRAAAAGRRPGRHPPAHVHARSRTSASCRRSTEAAILVVMAVVFLLLARVALGYFERRARAEGRLMARWQ